MNEEFATEVEKLYKVEEKHISEKDNLERQMQELQIKYQSEKIVNQAIYKMRNLSWNLRSRN